MTVGRPTRNALGMPRYGVDLKRTTASTTLALGVMQATATLPRRLKLCEAKFGCYDTAADNVFRFVIDRVTAQGSYAGSSAVTPSPLDSADAASVFDAGDTGISTNPTIGARLLSIPLNQRATCIWQALPGSELVSPATDNTGFAVLTPTASGALLVNAHCIVEE
jgi:hypothetical protein